MEVAFYIISVFVSGALFFVLSLIKNRSKFWWILYGFADCLVVIFISMAINQILSKYVHFEFDTKYIFLILYAFIFLLFLLFLPKSELTEREKSRIEKINSFIFNIFLAMKNQDYDDAYSYIKNGLRIDPANPILKQLERSFESSDYDYKKARKRLSLKYKIIIMIKNIKKLFGIKPKVNIQDDVIDV
jgi:hypothetical protein